jgi:GNAT superfamily N-acetyltransferase
LICGLAEFERAADQVTSTPALISELLFGTSATPSGAPATYAFVIDADAPENADSPLAGFALWSVRPSTWTGRYGIYLEDLYVEQTYRGRGYGTALFQRLIQECETRGYPRFEWSVLDWNEPAQKFYKSFQAKPLPEWVLWRKTFDLN